MSTKLTPCEERGFKVGDEFEVLGDFEGFKRGQIVTLYRDGSDDCVLFLGENSKYKICDGNDGAYLKLDQVRKLYKVLLPPPIAPDAAAKEVKSLDELIISFKQARGDALKAIELHDRAEKLVMDRARELGVVVNLNDAYLEKTK